jgi:hypothetical protein
VAVEDRVAQGGGERLVDPAPEVLRAGDDEAAALKPISVCGGRRQAPGAYSFILRWPMVSGDRIEMEVERYCGNSSYGCSRGFRMHLKAQGDTCVVVGSDVTWVT